MVQWLRIHLPIQGHRFDPCSGKTPRAAGQVSLCTTTTEAHTTERTVLCSERSHPKRIQPISTTENPPLTIRESPCAANKTQHSQNKKKRKKSGGRKQPSTWCHVGPSLAILRGTTCGPVWAPASFLRRWSHIYKSRVQHSSWEWDHCKEPRETKHWLRSEATLMIQICSELISFVRTHVAEWFSANFRQKSSPL